MHLRSCHGATSVHKHHNSMAEGCPRLVLMTSRRVLAAEWHRYTIRNFRQIQQAPFRRTTCKLSTASVPYLCAPTTPAHPRFCGARSVRGFPLSRLESPSRPLAPSFLNLLTTAKNRLQHETKRGDIPFTQTPLFPVSFSPHFWTTTLAQPPSCGKSTPLLSFSFLESFYSTDPFFGIRFLCVL